MIRHDAWTDFELTLLQGVVNDRDWYEQVCTLIPRSEAALRCKMSALRREAGIMQLSPGTPAGTAHMTDRQRAIVGSDRLRDAMLAVA